MLNYKEINKILKENKLDYIIIPTENQFMAEEFLESEKYLKYLLNFTGSKGIALIGFDKSVLFVDGRYTLQANKEVIKECEVKLLEENTTIKEYIEKNIKKNAIIGFDKLQFTDNSGPKFTKTINWRVRI